MLLETNDDTTQKMEKVYGDSNEANNNEISNNFGEYGERSRHGGTPIQEFYAGQSVLVTGGTGFLGKVLVEKLLRSCPHVARIYLLVRSKKGKSVETRLNELFEDRLFDRLKSELPKFRDKVIAINGDCSIEGLALSTSDREILTNDVSIVFHVAATVRFNEKLKLATAINVRSTNEMLEICKSMQKLKSFVHVSTAYANCHLQRIDEQFYVCSTSYDNLRKITDAMPEALLDSITDRIIGKWPNTYTFTKAIAEDLVREKSQNLPVGVFRPAIVTSTAYEPIKGWVDNIYGPTGLTVAFTSGITRVIFCDPNCLANIVPVDVTVNALIASAWDIYMRKQKDKDVIPIYNYVSTVEAPLTWNDFSHTNGRYVNKYPFSNSFWYLVVIMTKYKSLYKMYTLFLHKLPALLVDVARMCVGYRPSVQKLYKKIEKMNEALEFFSTNNWTFTNNNVQSMWHRLDANDQQLFKFNMNNFDWNKYLDDYVKGIRTYLLNDDINNIEKSRTRWKRLYWIHQLLKTFVFVIVVWTGWNVFLRICK